MGDLMMPAAPAAPTAPAAPAAPGAPVEAAGEAALGAETVAGRAAGALADYKHLVVPHNSLYDLGDNVALVAAVNKFVGDGVKFVVGDYNSGVSIPASETYQENGIVQITPASTNPTFTERKMWNVFRTCGRDDQQGAVASDYILSHLAGKKIAIEFWTTKGKLVFPQDFVVKLVFKNQDRAIRRTVAER